MARRGSLILYAGKRGHVWRAKYVLPDDDGRPRRVMRTLGPARTKQQPDGMTRKEARAALDDLVSDARQRGVRRREPTTFRRYAEQWFEREEVKRGRERTTVVTYTSTRRRLIDAFGGRRVEAIRPRDVADYGSSLTKQVYGAALVRRDHAVLHSLFKSAKAAERVDSNPCEGAELPRLPEAKPWILGPEEVRSILRAFTDERARVLFLTLELTGIRQHEAKQLRWRNVDLVDGVLRVVESKSRSGVRSIALSPALTDALAVWKDTTAFAGEDEYVFAHQERGTQLQAEWFKQELRAAMIAAGIDRIPEWTYKDAKGCRRGGFRPFHDQRHSSLTHSAAAGTGEIALMTAAGHGSISITKRYLHLAGSVLRDEAEALERRLLGGQPSTASSTDLEGRSGTSTDLDARSGADSVAADVQSGNKLF